MTDYMCSTCETVYSRDEYRALEKVPVDPEEENPMKGKGYDKLCPDCGKRIFTEKWIQQNTVKHDGMEFTISTVALIIPHGLDRDQWYETCIFHETGSSVVDRYETKIEARIGHSEIIGKVAEGSYSMETTSQRLKLE